MNKLLNLNIIVWNSQRSTIKLLTRNIPTTVTKNMTTECQMKNVFKGKQDRYNGVIVDSTFEPCNIDEFSVRLTESLNLWTTDNKRGVWFKVATDHADWVPILTRNGFLFHHAKDNFVMLYKWLPKDEQCNVPQYAHTMLGVGAVVINDKNQILVVKEKYFIGAPHWKLPGGYVESGEELVDAAIREVFEETNIKTKFNSLLSVRHTHRVMFQCSDIYTVMSLEPLSSDITTCSRELTASKWMDIDEYLKSDNVSELNKMFVQKYLEYKKENVVIDVNKAIHPILNKPYTVYSVSKNQ